MRTLIVGAVVSAGVMLGIDVLGDLTQTRPDAADRDGATRIELALSVKGETGQLAFVADGLWGACQGTVHRRLEDEGWMAVGGSPGRFKATVYPALGEHARRRLRGCLEDATLDRAQARVVAMERVPLCPSASGTAATTCAVVRRPGG